MILVFKCIVLFFNTGRDFDLIGDPRPVESQGRSMYCISVDIVEDGIAEGTETFSVIFTIEGVDSVCSVSIMDEVNSPPSSEIVCAQSEYRFEEGSDNQRVCVNISDLNGGLRVGNLTAQSDTATGNIHLSLYIIKY